MALYELTDDEIRPLRPTTFADAAVRERENLQSVIRERLEVISPGTMLLAEEFGQWEDSRRRIDLLALDQDANLVVIELKRTETGGHMELQAVRYAAMISAMTFRQAVGIYEAHLASLGAEDRDAEAEILDFLEWEDPDEDAFAQEVRIVLASAEFSRELTTAVMWLNERGIDIRCVRYRPYKDGHRVFIDVQQIIPLPEAEEYQVQLREKAQRERSSRKSSRDYSRYDVVCNGIRFDNLPKRHAVLQVIKGLVAEGVDPDEISRVVPFRKANWAIRCEGEHLTHADVLPHLEAAIMQRGNRFDPRRFHLNDEDLIRGAGCTYVVSNQWGGRAIEWAISVLERFPNSEVSIVKAQ